MKPGTYAIVSTSQAKAKQVAHALYDPTVSGDTRYHAPCGVTWDMNTPLRETPPGTRVCKLCRPIGPRTVPELVT